MGLGRLFTPIAMHIRSAAVAHRFPMRWAFIAEGEAPTALGWNN